MKSSNHPAYRHIHEIPDTTLYNRPFRGLLFTNQTSSKVTITFTTTDINGESDTVRVATRAESSFLFPFAATSIKVDTISAGDLGTDVHVYTLG